MSAVDLNASIFVAGHRGMVGNAIVRGLQARGYTNVITRSRTDLDLRDAAAVNRFYHETRPDFVFIAAARVGGIVANNAFRAEFLYDNLMIECNLIHGAHLVDVDRLMFLGSSCIYPRDCPQPIKEEYLLTGPLEWTNEPYAIAKIAGVKLCDNYNIQYGRHYFSGMPTNAYGPNDDYHPENSHVMAALIRKAHLAKAEKAGSMEVWGTGTPRREFIFVHDLADACIHLMEAGYDGSLINLGVNEDISITDLTKTVCDVVGFDGEIVFNTDRPDGTPRKLMDSSRMAALGWSPKVALRDGIRQAYQAAPFYAV